MKRIVKYLHPSNGVFQKLISSNRVIAMTFYATLRSSFAETQQIEPSNVVKRLCTEDDGVTAIEYGLLAALISVVIVGAVSATGTQLGALFAAWSSAVSAAIQGAL